MSRPTIFLDWIEEFGLDGRVKARPAVLLETQHLLLRVTRGVAPLWGPLSVVHTCYTAQEPWGGQGDTYLCPCLTLEKKDVYVARPSQKILCGGGGGGGRGRLAFC